MNQFEQRITELRKADKAARAAITIERDKRFTEINLAIAFTDDPHERRRLREKKDEVYREARLALRWQRRVYHQQREIIETQYAEYRREREDVSWRMVRRAMNTILRFALQRDEAPESVTFTFGQGMQATVIFRGGIQ